MSLTPELIAKLKKMEDDARLLLDGLAKMRIFFEDVERISAHHRSRIQEDGPQEERMRLVTQEGNS